MWPRGHPCDILVENMAAFELVWKSDEDKLKSFRLMALTNSISRQTSIDFVLWFLVASLMEIHNEKEQDEQGKHKMYSFRRKGGPRKRLMKSLILNVTKGMVTSGQGPIQPSFQFMKKN